MFENGNSSLFDQASDSGILVELIQHLSFYGDGVLLLSLMETCLWNPGLQDEIHQADLPQVVEAFIAPFPPACVTHYHILQVQPVLDTSDLLVGI